MKVKDVIVHLFKGGWAVYRVQGGGPLSDFLHDGSPVPEGEPGGVVVFIREGEMWPVQVHTPPKLKGGEKRRVRGKRTAKLKA